MKVLINLLAFIFWMALWPSYVFKAIGVFWEMIIQMLILIICLPVAYDKKDWRLWWREGIRGFKKIELHHI